MGTATTPLQQDERLVDGPAIAEIVTPFDRALSCLDGRINRDVLRFSVGSILDSTGKEQLSDGGSSKFVTQGAGEIVQSALFRAGVVLVNRRDPRVMESEARWGIRDPKSQIPSTFYITGSINSLDFLPGGGLDVQIAGVGPRYRQHRMLVGLDLSLTETKTGRILANVPLQKQIVATEEGLNVGRFFGNTLVSMDLGHNKREAVHFALRQMLNLATFELLTQVMSPDKYADCYELIESVDGVLGESRSGKRLAQYRQFLKDKERTAALASTRASTAAVTAAAAESAADAKAMGNGAVTTTGAAETTEASAAPKAATNGNGSTAPVAYFKNETETHDPATLKALELLRSTPAREPVEDSGVNPVAPLQPALPNPPVAPSAVPAAAVTAVVAKTATPVQPAQTARQGKLPANWPSYCQVPADVRLPSVTPLRSNAAGNTLQVQSPQASELCVVDASGKSWWLKLQAGVPETLSGTAPWRVLSDGPLKPLAIEFQGSRLRIPSYVTNRMELNERR